MTFSLPSALAAATSASMPPQSDAEAAVFALSAEQAPEVPPPLLPQAATTTIATTARPRPRIELPNFILRSPPDTAQARARRQFEQSNDGDAPPTLQGHRSGVPVISVRPRLTRPEVQVRSEEHTSELQSPM